ncbi:hypothetical protein DIS24_g11290 [Lasiodiplodia hormozganensis]|uniref:Uncharacterized protein n=1 Tax=Lasiodiplodia hormozganensis TaxID=869390 RepID=A0AA39WV59_9PEZI|nr:hypothetical protein DIS24_g11290 [Lasiodiplodia hormozganensis]
MENVIGTLTKYAPNIPVFIVATKKDRFLKDRDDIENKDIKAIESSQDVSPDTRAKVDTILQQRQKFFEDTFNNDCRGFRKDHMWFAFVSKYDQQSIRALVNRTVDEIADDSVYMSLIAAQVCDVQPKVELAINETIRFLGHAIRTMYVASPALIGAGVVAPTVSRLLCNRIIRCFGFPKIEAKYVDDIMSKVVWSNLAKFMTQTFAPDTAVAGGMAALTLVTGGIALIPGIPFLETPPAARLIIKCACDLILILQCAFQSGNNKFVTNEEIRAATIEYKTKGRSRTGGVYESIRDVVHKEINKLIPLMPSKQAARMLSNSNKSRIQATMRDIISDNAFTKEDPTLFRQDSISTSSLLSSSSFSTEVEEISVLFKHEEGGGVVL